MLKKFIKRDILRQRKEKTIMSEENQKFNIDDQESTIHINLSESIKEKNMDQTSSGNTEEAKSSVDINLSDISEEEIKRIDFIQDMILNGHLQTARDVICKWKCQNDFLPSGETLLHFCQQIHSIPGTKMLLELGADPTLRSKNDYSACYYAVRNDLPEYMELYLTHMNNQQLEHLKNDVFYKDDNSLLHCAVWFCRAEMNRLLLSYGFNPNKKNNLGQTPIHLLGIRHEKATAQAFFNTPNAIKPDLSIRDKHGNIPEEAVYYPEIRKILHRERRKDLLTIRKMSYEERRLLYLKKQAYLRIKKLKRLRMQMRARGGLENV